MKTKVIMKYSKFSDVTIAGNLIVLENRLGEVITDGQLVSSLVDSKATNFSFKAWCI
jgi:hypothetical protein